MEPHIRYARTTDGVSIAYYALGEGKAVVMLPALPYSHIALAWQRAPAVRLMAETVVARGRRFVAYDSRGLGSSTRDAAMFSLDAFVADLEAVAQALLLEPFDLFAPSTSAPIAITYAARHPERVSHLGLYAPVARYADLGRSPLYQAIWALRGQDWDTYAQTTSHLVAGLEWSEQARTNAALLREATTPEIAKRIWAAMDQFDVVDLLPSVRTPTLVVVADDAQQKVFPPDLAKTVAAGIPQAQLVAPMPGVPLEVPIGQFFGILAAGESPPAPESAPSRRVVTTVLFTDLVGHTEMMQRLGDDRGRDVLREHERITRETLKQYGGAEVKTMGDGFMASFGSVTKAMDCAIALQRAFAAWNEERPTSETDGPEGPSLRNALLSVRIGLNAGEPIEEDGDLFGSTVILASRIAAQAGAGEILIPEPLRHLLSGKSYVYADRGETMLKGFEDAVRLYEVRWRE